MFQYFSTRTVVFFNDSYNDLYISRYKKNIFKMASMESTSSEEPLKKSDGSVLSEEPLKQYTQKAMSRTLKLLLKNLKFQLFKDTYPELCLEHSAHLQEIHSQLRLQLEDTFKKTLEDDINEVNLYHSLSVLDNLKSQTESSDKEEWRPCGAPEEDVRAHLHQVKLKHKKCLEFQLQTFTRQNEALEQIMEGNHQEILGMKDSIDLASRDIKNHFENLNDGSLAKLHKNICSSWTHDV